MGKRVREACEAAPVALPHPCRNWGNLRDWEEEPPAPKAPNFFVFSSYSCE